ncbi:MAG: hypothetical protein U5K76_06940 [Woeseiaceae bacterium]|nr:hypothetical protein [Woeseiaceae bacterium]
MSNKIDEFLTEALKKSSSDLHSTGDCCACVFTARWTRRRERWTTEFARDALYEIMSGTAKNEFENRDSVDFAYEIPGISRFRVNVMRHLNGIGAVFRAIPSNARRSKT